MSNYWLYRRTYYTLQEMLDIYEDDVSIPANRHDSSMSSTWFSSLLTQAGLSYTINGLSSNITTSTDIINALMTIVYNRHANDYIYYLDFDFDDTSTYTLSTSDFTGCDGIHNILNVIELTAPKYIPLFLQFQDKSDAPIGQVSSTSTGVSRFNDTPQDGGDYSDDEHTTNITQSSTTTSTDMGTIMSRLGELYTNFKSIILEWANEFDSLFIKEEQIV